MDLKTRILFTRNGIKELLTLIEKALEEEEIEKITALLEDAKTKARNRVVTDITITLKEAKKS